MVQVYQASPYGYEALQQGSKALGEGLGHFLLNRRKKKQLDELLPQVPENERSLYKAMDPEDVAKYILEQKHKKVTYGVESEAGALKKWKDDATRLILDSAEIPEDEKGARLAEITRVKSLDQIDNFNTKSLPTTTKSQSELKLYSGKAGVDTNKSLQLQSSQHQYDKEKQNVNFSQQKELEGMRNANTKERISLSQTLQAARDAKKKKGPNTPAPAVTRERF